MRFAILSLLLAGLASAFAIDAYARLNAEANLNVLDPAFAAEQARVFDADLQRAHRVTLDEWRNRPLAERLKEGLASMIKWQL